MTFGMIMVTLDLGCKGRALEEAGIVVLAKLVEEALGVDPDGGQVGY